MHNAALNGQPNLTRIPWNVVCVQAKACESGPWEAPKRKDGSMSPGRFVLAITLVFGVAGVAACGNDDGATVRNLNDEEPLVPDSGS